MELTAVQFLLKQYTKNKGKITSSDVAKAKKIENEQSLKMPDYNLDDLANFYSTSTLFIKNKELPTQQQIEDAEHISEISFKAGFQKAIELLTFKSE